VSKANDLVEAKYRLTVQEQKLIIMAISKINPMKPDFENPYRLSVDEVAEACGLERTGIYQKVAATVDRLMTRLVKLKEDDGHRVVHWVSEAKYYTGMGHFDLWFHDKMKPYLLDLKEYVSYDRKAVLQFQSQYSFRVYEILKKWQGSNKQNQFSVKVDQLREVLGVRKTELKLFGDFNRYVIKKAQTELMQESDLMFTYTTWKEGRAVAGIVFTIKENVPTGKPKRKKRGRPKKEDRSLRPTVDLFETLDEDARGIYSESLTRRLNAIGIRNLEQYKDEGIKEKHFLLALEIHELSEKNPAGKVISTARDELEKSNSAEAKDLKERSQTQIIKRNKEFWESNKHKYEGISFSEAYLQSKKGLVIAWTEDEFEAKLDRYRKSDQEDDRGKDRRSGKKSLISGSSLATRSEDRRKEDLGKESRELENHP
jgi:plasmid replication initiation protein